MSANSRWDLIQRLKG